MIEYRIGYFGVKALQKDCTLYKLHIYVFPWFPYPPQCHNNHTQKCEGHISEVGFVANPTHTVAVTKYTLTDLVYGYSNAYLYSI